MSKPLSVPIPKLYKPWIILCVVVLLGSLLLLAVAVTMGMVAFGSATTPLWVVVVGALAVLGIVGGFTGFFALMLFAGWQTWREARRVQVIPPEHAPHP